MKFASVRELKNNASQLLRLAGGGEGIIITSHGRPVAALQGINDETLEDFILSGSDKIRTSLEEAYREYKDKGGAGIDDVISKLKKKREKKKR